MDKQDGTRLGSFVGGDPVSAHPAADLLVDRFALLADNLPESFWLIDVAARRVVYANPAYEALWGASRDELFKDRFSWLSHVHPDDQDRARNAVKQNRYGGLDEQIRVKHADGGIRWLRLKSFAIGDGGRPHSVGGIAFDITPQIEHQAALGMEKEAHRYAASLKKSVIDALPAPVVILDGAGVIKETNAPWLSFATDNGYTAPGLGEGQTYAAICGAAAGLGDESCVEMAEGLRAVLEGVEDRFSLTYLNSSAGRERWIRALITPLRGTGPTGAVIMHVDVTESVAANERIRHLAHFDSITGLPNRTQFQERLSAALENAEHHGQRVIVVSMALDRFRAINESCGYDVGDQILALVGSRIRQTLRPRDTVGRLGGDQFAVILAEIEETWDISHTADRLLSVVSQPLELDGQTFHLTASMGIAIYPADGDQVPVLLQGAEAAMFRAKAAGRNAYQFSDPSLNEFVRVQQRLEAELHRAIEEQQFVLHYQPKTSCDHGHIVGLEALVRWQHPERGLIGPMEFVPLLEETGLVVRVGEWVLNQVCKQLATWLSSGVPCVPVAVNLSAKQLQGTQIYHTVQRALDSANVPASYLDLELTESMLMDNVEEIIPVLASLKALGIRLSVDDFGTGYSSLAYLKRFPLDALKVDKSFVQDIIADPSDASITRAIITMAHSLKLKVIAEGVETEGQLGMLIGNHCDEIQGYFFSRPVPAEEVTRMLKEDTKLPAHMLKGTARARTLLLVDDDESILETMRQLLRRENYRILTATSGEEGLQLLAANPVDVILSNQCMPGMTGVEFLRLAKELYPSTVRMVLSGYTDLQAVTSAINEGAVAKFLTKPWDDEQLRQHIAESFNRKEMADENERLASEVKVANQELAQANARLEELLAQKQQQILRDETALSVFQEMLQMLPWPLVGIDSLGLVAALNGEAEQLFGSQGTLLGTPMEACLPRELVAMLDGDDSSPVPICLDGLHYRAVCRPMGHVSAGRGHMLVLIPEGTPNA